MWKKVAALAYCINIGIHSKKKMLGCFYPNLGQIWTNPNAGLKM